MSNKITDDELNMLIDLYGKHGDSYPDTVIARAAEELKEFREKAETKEREEKMKGLSRLIKRLGAGKTATEMIEEAKDEFCKGYCKYAAECEERMEKDELLRPCPLDKL